MCLNAREGILFIEHTFEVQRLVPTWVSLNAREGILFIELNWPLGAHQILLSLNAREGILFIEHIL